jgi:hypothetical protein
MQVVGQQKHFYQKKRNCNKNRALDIYTQILIQVILQTKSIIFYAYVTSGPFSNVLLRSLSIIVATALLFWAQALALDNSHISLSIPKQTSSTYRSLWIHCYHRNVNNGWGIEGIANKSNSHGKNTLPPFKGWGVGVSNKQLS